MTINVKHKVKFFLVLVFFSFSVITKSQTKNDAIDTYNLGVQLISTDLEMAIKHFNECLDICTSIGAEGKEIRINVEKQLPGLYYKSAINLYKEKKTAEAIKSFEETLLISEKYEDIKTKDRTKNILSQLYYAKGNNYYKKQDYENAVIDYDKALELNPKYTKAYLNKGLVYKKLEDIENLLATMDKAIEFAREADDSTTLAKAKKTCRDYLMNKGTIALENKSFDEAINFLTTSLNYDDQNPGIYFRLTSAYNKQEKWDDAIKSARKALEFEENNKEKTAKIYYELGNAYLAKDDNNAACQAYKNAAYGAYIEAANYQIQHVLKCD